MQGQEPARAPRFDASVWSWVRAALACGMGAVVAGLVVGALTGVVNMACCAIVATLVFFLGWSGWWLARVGPAAIGAGFLGFVACVAGGLELPRAWRLTRAPVHHVVSLRAWPASDTSSVLHVEGIVLDDSSAWPDAVPLVEGSAGLVVGFACIDATTPHRPRGPWLVPGALWSVEFGPACDTAVASSVALLRKSGRSIDPIADQRRYVSFGTEASIRRFASPRAIVRVFAVLFASYALLVVVFRRRGADSVHAP
jgi:hypothetical protein